MSKIIWNGDANSAVKAQEALTGAMEDYVEAAKGGVLNAKQLEGKARAIAEQAAPQEKYNRKMRELAELVAKGKLNMDQAAHAAARYQKELEKAGDAGKKAFSTVDMLKYATGVASIGGAIGAITQAFEKAEASAQATADAILDSLGAVGEMQQLGPEGLATGLRIQRELIANGTVGPNQRAAAADIAANMVNAGLSEDEQRLLVNDLGGAGGLVKGENMSKVGGDLRSLMTQFKETDMRDVAARVMVAANKTKADLAATSNNVLKFGELAASSGIGLNEAMAGYVASEISSASPESAAEMQKSFYSQVFRRQLGKDGSLEATLDNITSQIKPGGTAFDVLGDANAVIGYQALMKDRAVLAQNIGDVSRPKAGMIKDSGALLANADPVYAAAAAAKREEGAASIVEQKMLAERELLFEAVMSARKTKAIAEGGGGAGHWMLQTLNRLNDAVGNEEDTLRKEYMAYQQGDSSMSEETFKRIEAYLQRQTQLMEEGATQSNGSRAVRPE